MAPLWTDIPNLWEPSGLVHFVVGVAETRKFAAHRDVLVALCPVVEAAVTGNFKESERQEVQLPQFQPDDFELFLRFALSGAFCSLPEVQPVINDNLVLRVVPIAAYLGAKAMLDVMEEHVQKAATFATVLAFEEANVSVHWDEDVFSALFKDVTIRKNCGPFQTHNKVTFDLSTPARESLAKLSSPTLAQLVKYLVERKCLET
uniref:BTB domain-containing protein n=1 Tax=Noctiluca scintillans TaxID=2966 RepID=A0A7S1AAZ2_NOCSC|mmetsp:Transcript_38909/g.103389  ORF Transcript_38909/g.103389 Transcript_38909/m.103389 type:complete len:204 (+) Transcript_38909:50-661(+)|eukprot:CAMPEP_0194513060 /NCGR_PEP_ID=MMETSP0253-20130528/45240_1 /TAXON_ID=2966 /ORGANISM="Noctiluca scintillans" /LENGTH=203 /DNA_ID=CAMNT_0039356579 /DNA_START=37 /DNA_END=648 /DNA_ORIENTATION=-